MNGRVLLTRFSTRARDVVLTGLVYTPPVPSAATVVLAHGLTASKESLDVLANYLCTRGWRCVTFDFRGHKLGGSTGEMRSAGDAMEDMQTVIAYCRRHFGSDRLVLAGHSMGGSVALIVAQLDTAVAGVATLGTGCGAIHGFDTPAGEALMAQRGDYVIGAPARTLLEEVGELCNRSAGKRRIPALFMAARSDILVRVDSVRTLAQRHAPDAEFVVVDGAHMELPLRARGPLADWLERFRP